MGSRSVQHFNKRKATNRNALKRRKAIYQPRKKVLIVCEGKKTEPNYFNSLIAHLNLTAVDLKISGDSGSAPKSVVEFGIEKLKFESDIDLAFFVFDKDSHDSYTSALSMVENLKTKRKYRRKIISAITSNPCFEVWFLMHFGTYDRPFASSSGKSPCDNVIAALKKQNCFRNYSKGQCNLFDLLSNRLNIAINNAAQVLKRSEETRDKKHHGNPTTFVHELVVELQRLAKEQVR